MARRTWAALALLLVVLRLGWRGSGTNHGGAAAAPPVTRRHVRRGGPPRPHTWQPPAEPAGTTWVSLATDLASPEYALHLPLTAYIWAHFLGARPLVFIVPRSAALSARDRFIIEWTRQAGARIEVVLPRAGDLVSTVAQTARLAAWAVPGVAPGDYIVTADTDIWPVSRAYWGGALATRAGATIVNGEFFTANAGSDNRVAISYVGMRAELWARVVGRAAGVGADAAHALGAPASGRPAPAPPRPPAVDEVVAAILDLGRQAVGGRAWDAAGTGHAPKAHAQWSWDQRFLTGAVLAAARDEGTPITLGAGLTARRLDRAGWNFTGDAEAYSDAHLLSPLTDEAVWGRLRQVWVSMFGSAAWADAYRAGACRMFV